MRCPECFADENRVKETREVPQDGDDYIYRRRQCSKCGHTWATYEQFERADTESVFRVREAIKKLDAARAILAGAK